MSSGCPFAKTAPVGAVCPMRSGGDVDKHEARGEDGDRNQNNGSETVPAKCPFGYDSHTFKLGPLSCMICKALLFESSKCVPCAHKFCKACISRFKDCPLCGADIDKIEPDSDLQITVERFINGHARIKRAQVNADGSEIQEQKNVIYADVSMERGAFLVQQAMRAFQAKNIESARSRLSLCAEDIREQLQSLGNTAELCSQLGAILGMLGDCCRAMGDAGQAVDYYEESVEFLIKVPAKDLELVHTLSVSLNKIGDLKYYDGDLQSARSYYIRSLDVRREAAKQNSNVSSQIIDVAVSLAKVADVDRTLKNEPGAINGFQEAVELLESLKLNSDESNLEQRVCSAQAFYSCHTHDIFFTSYTLFTGLNLQRVSVLDFVRGQIEEKKNDIPAST
ncbi:Zinc finger RING/FYVE/PHD-type protein [Dioscorea alata]|uniref:Zinc finger RING/FYVE/PHD-type protein n=1 Tax=Dioscorea alata TaxID=55571 RepID=A0ACB7VT52_DIOAL|nr:Zinc finger RING/FYVE/PHD-type protein [Dioscorea alata]